MAVLKQLQIHSGSSNSRTVSSVVGEELCRVDTVWDSQLCCLQDCLGSLHAQETGGLLLGKPSGIWICSWL